MRPHHLPKHYGKLDGWAILSLFAMALSTALAALIFYALWSLL